MKEDNERVEALNAIFDDDPMQKEREKEIRRLEKKREKQLAKLQKKGIDPEQQRSEETVKEADADEKKASDKILNEDGESIDKPKKKKKKEKKKQEKEEINIVKDLISLAIYILAIVAVCWLILTYVGQRTEVSGDSMNDTLHDGDSLWIDKLSYRFKDPERFDIVVFPYEEEDETYYIKRIIGLPGETVYIDEDGVIYINDEPLEENYGKEVIEENHRGLAAEAVTLGNDEYFVMGDNRNNSRDSRLSDVGNIHKDKFVGKAVFRFTGGFGFLNKEEQ
uniref:signal peptidase I n=1 Tax=Coprococcus sp. TaxID=2049024 RepID=UPI004028C5F7